MFRCILFDLSLWFFTQESNIKNINMRLHKIMAAAALLLLAGCGKDTITTVDSSEIGNYEDGIYMMKYNEVVLKK